MKFTKKRKGYSRSRSDSGVSCDSTRSSADPDKNTAHEGNMANVAEQLENEGKRNVYSTHTSSKLAKQQELFLSNLNMKLKPDSGLKKTNIVGKSTRCFLSDTSTQIETNNTGRVMLGKCEIQNKEDWNKYMVGKPSKSKTSKSYKRIKHPGNCNLELNATKTSDTSKLNVATTSESNSISCNNIQNKRVPVDTQITTEISLNTSCSETTQVISDETMNRLNISSPKAKKARISKVNNPAENTLLNYDNTREQVTNNLDISSPKKAKIKKITGSTTNNMGNTEDSDIASPKNKRTKFPKLKNTIENSHNIDNTIEEVINSTAKCDSKVKKTLLQEVNQTTEITATNTEDSEEMTNQVMINSGFTCPRSRSRRKSNKSVNTTLDSSINNDQSIKKTVKASNNNLQLEQQESLPKEINLSINSVSTLSVETVEDFTNADNSEQSTRKHHRTRSIESDKKSTRKRKNSDTNSIEIQSPKFKKTLEKTIINYPETGEFTKDLASEENLLVQKVKKSKKKTNVNTELLNTGSGNNDVVDTELDSHQNDIIQKLRNKYSTLLNCNLNPFVRVEKLLPFSNNQWISKATTNANVIEEVNSQISIKPDPDDSLAVSDSSAYILVTDSIEVDSIKSEEISPVQLRNVRIILSDFKREKQRKKIINLNRKWNLSKDTHHVKSAFKYKFTDDLVSINSLNEVFCGAHLAEGFSNITSPILSPVPLEKSTVTETFEKSDPYSNEEINENLPISGNDSTTENSTIEQLNTKQILVKSTDKLDKNNQRIHRTKSQEKENEILSEKLNKVKPVTETCSKILHNKVSLEVDATSTIDQIELEKSKKSGNKFHKSNTKITRRKSHQNAKSESSDKLNEVKAESGRSKKLEDKFENVESNDKHNKFNDKRLIRGISKEKVIGTRSEKVKEKETFEQCLAKCNKRDENKSTSSVSESNNKITSSVSESNNKINSTKNKIVIKSPDKLNNELKNKRDENKSTSSVSESNNKINSTKNKIVIKSPDKLNNELKNKRDENIDLFAKSKKPERDKTRNKIVQTNDNKITEGLLKAGNYLNHDLKANNIKYDTHAKNKKSDQKHKHIKSELSHKTENEILSKNIKNTMEESKLQTESENINRENIRESTEANNETVTEQLPPVKNLICKKHALANMENKNIDIKHNKKDHFDKTTKTTVEITQNKNDEQTNSPSEIEEDARKQLPIENDISPTCSNTKPKHVFKFVEKSDIKRPPSRMPRKIVLNRPTMDTFKVPVSPMRKSIKSEVAASPSPTKLIKDSSQRYEKEYDSLSIYADTIGVESVTDTASIRNDSDSDNDFSDDLIHVLPDTIDTIKHTNLNEWVENSLKICEIQKHAEQLNKEIESSEEIVPVEMSFRHELEEQSKKEISSTTSLNSVHVKVEEKKTEHVQHPKEISEDSKISCNVSNKYQGIDIFKYVCNSIKAVGECQRKACCHFMHEFPPEWKNELKSLPIESILALYDHAKEKRFVFLFKKICSSITEYLGDKRDFNNLIKMVKDVLEINMNSDRTPFISDIINGLCKTGVTYQSIVEVVYKNANVNKNLINLLSDILLNLTIDKGDSNGNWPIIKELMQNRNYDIDNGIIQFIIIESLEKDATQKDFVVRVYHDLIKNISDEKLSGIFQSLLNNFYTRLEKYNFVSEAHEFLTRCQSINVILGSKSDHTNTPSSSTVCSPTVKNISKVPPFQSTPLKREPKFENVSPVVSVPSNINFVTPINKPFSQPQPLINLGVENSAQPPPTPLNNPMPPVFNYPPPVFPPKLFTKPPPLNYKQKPVSNQKMSWYPQPTRRRQTPVCIADNSAPSTSGIPYTPATTIYPAQNNLLNKDEVRRAVFQEDISGILHLITKFKDNHFTDLFIKTFIEAMLEKKHTFPVFFGNLCHAAMILNNLKDNTSAYVIKTIGLNIILHLTQTSNWEEAYTVYKTVRNLFSDDLFNVKLYLPERYSYFKRILIISLIHIKQGLFDVAWSMLLDHAFQYHSLWQGENNESEIAYRNSIIEELLKSVTMKKNWVTGLNIVQYLIKNNVTGVDVKTYINDILLHAINKKCNINDIMKFVNCSPNWYNYISKHIFRSLVVHTVAIGCWSYAKNFYIIGCNFEIYPQLIGNERHLTFSIRYIFEEIQLMLEIFFENMTRFRPIKHNIVLRVVDEIQIIPTAELPINLQQYQITTTIMQVRIINILNNFIKPAITITKQNNAIVISAEVVNRHLEGRINSNKPRLDS